MGTKFYLTRGYDVNNPSGAFSPSRPDGSASVRVAPIEPAPMTPILLPRSAGSGVRARPPLVRLRGPRKLRCALRTSGLRRRRGRVLDLLSDTGSSTTSTAPTGRAAAWQLLPFADVAPETRPGPQPRCSGQRFHGPTLGCSPKRRLRHRDSRRQSRLRARFRP